MEDKIEEILSIYDEGYDALLVQKLSTLITQERKDAVEGFVNWWNSVPNEEKIPHDEISRYFRDAYLGSLLTHNSEEGDA